MISQIPANPQKVQMIERDHLLRLLNNGLEVKSFRFVRQAALAWLSAFPGDLVVNLFYVRALIQEDRGAQAAQILEKILKTDPLFSDALKVAVVLLSKEKPELAIKANGVLQAMGAMPGAEVSLPDWGQKLLQVRQAIENRQLETAQALLMSQIGEPGHPEITDLLHLELTQKISDAASVLNLARLYQVRWPECLQIKLILANAWMETGNDDDAVKLLHFCAANDAAAQVPERLWGANFAYRPLYPAKLEIVSNFSVPAEVAGKMGMNQLAPGFGLPTMEPKKPARTDVTSFDGYKVLPSTEGDYQAHPKTEPIVPQAKHPVDLEVEQELKKVATSLQQPVLVSTDNRFPAYVVLTMKKGLENQFGLQSAQVILDEVKELQRLVHEKNGWSSILFMPDDLETCGRYGITPIDSIDPWKIKLALVDLDKALQRTGERVGCVLIVGGDEVVPFHKLPNPTEDSDIEVKSDNPYGSLDTNYFVSDWPVGRLPGEDGDEVGLLLTQIRNATQYHSEEAELHTWLNRIFNVVRVWNRPWLRHFGNVGYSASVWKRSSLAAFHPVGEGRNLFLSPSGKQSSFNPVKLTNAPLAYFNLHGVEDGGDWYGQKDPADNLSGPDYPVALRPVDLIKNSNNPRIVFCEACYGGHIFGKKESESIALTMSGIGVLAIIGSSTISYGSVTTPLIGADLLGYLIMKNLKESLPIGSAFIKARVEFVREMNRRQGYLDGEDQKTLISFILYGDPLVAYDPYQASTKTIGRDTTAPVVKTICDRTSFEEVNETVAPRMISQAKELVKDYLPGIEYAEVKIQNQEARFSSVGGKSLASQPKRVVVSFSKQFNQAEKVHKQFAKVTLDQLGQMVKLAVSR